VTVAVKDVASACRAALFKACEGDKQEMKDFDRSKARKLAMLEKGRVLTHRRSPGGGKDGGGRDDGLEAAELALTRAAPLPDALLTCLQVEGQKCGAGC